MNSDITDFEVKCTFGKGSDTAGPDDISAQMLDKADSELMHYLLKQLWNKAWKTGTFIKDWKQENRVVIKKPGKDDYHECSAYRTISITSHLGKRMEYITSQRLVQVLKEIGFDSDQHAYLPGRSSTQAILTLVECIKKSLIKDQFAGAVFFDFTDAFGSIDRIHLIEKIRKDFRISGLLLEHIRSFLTERIARIMYDHGVGNWLPSIFGTSAGTRLGPLLFVMYIHDVPHCIKPKYADDLVALAVGPDLTQIEESLQHATDGLVCWANQHGMNINAV